MNCFLEAFFVAPLFLYICIAVFGAWAKHKNIFNWVIYKENIAIFGENVFLTQKLCHGPNFHHQPSFIH